MFTVHRGSTRWPATHPRSHDLYPPSNFALAEAAAYLLCYTLVHLGYFIHLKKSCLIPQLRVPFLGFLSDSSLQAFLLPDDKKEKFVRLRESILSKKTVSLKSLQKFAGKTLSFSLVVPAARLYTSAVYHAISTVHHTSRPQPLQGELLREIQSWRFLDTWSGYMPWRAEFHIRLSLSSDASATGWGGTICFPGDPVTVVQGLWNPQERSQSVAVREAQALFHTLVAAGSRLHNARVDCHVDNQVLISSWNRGGSKCPDITRVLKDIFTLTLSCNVHLTLFYISSQANPADGPSRVLSDLDCTLAPSTWHSIQESFGPHTVDLMALPANVMLDDSGTPLPFFSPFPTVTAVGVNVFAQHAISGNAYVFPPFTLVGPLLRFLEHHPCTYSIVVPDLYPRRYWWPLLQSRCSASFLLGRKGDREVLLFPSKAIPFETRPLQWDLWVFHILHS